MSEERMRRDLTGVEAALSSLSPTPTGVDRDRLMYLAGRAAAASSVDARRPRAQWAWSSVTAASLLAAATFAALWAVGAKPEVAREVVVVRREEPDGAQPSQQGRAPLTDRLEGPVPAERPPEDRYFQLRRLVLSEGIGALPERGSPGGSAPALRETEAGRWRVGSRPTLRELLKG